MIIFFGIRFSFYFGHFGTSLWYSNNLVLAKPQSLWFSMALLSKVSCIQRYGSNWEESKDVIFFCIHSNLDITNFDIVNFTIKWTKPSSHFDFWGFTKACYICYSEIIFDIVNKKGLTNLFAISRFECIVFLSDSNRFFEEADFITIQKFTLQKTEVCDQGKSSCKIFLL